MKNLPTCIVTAFAFLFVSGTSALADLDWQSAPRVAREGLGSLAWGVAAAGLFIGIGLAIGRRQ
jgi:hypothetical protein